MLRWHRAVQYRLVDGIHRARWAKKFALSLHARTQPFAPKNVMDERERSEHARPSITFFGLPSTLGGPELQAITGCIRDMAARTFRCRRPQCLPCAVEDRAPSAPRDPDAKDAKDARDRQRASRRFRVSRTRKPCLVGFTLAHACPQSCALAALAARVAGRTAREEKTRSQQKRDYSSRDDARGANVRVQRQGPVIAQPVRG